MIGDCEPAAEIVPEGDPQLGASLGQSEEGITAVAANIAAGSPADVAFGDLAAAVVLRALGVQWDVWMVEHGSNSVLLACSRWSRRSRVAKPV